MTNKSITLLEIKSKSIKQKDAYKETNHMQQRRIKHHNRKS